MLKREIRLLFCGDTFFEVVGGKIDKLFFLLIAFDMVEAKLLMTPDSLGRDSEKGAWEIAKG